MTSRFGAWERDAGTFRQAVREKFAKLHTLLVMWYCRESKRAKGFLFGAAPGILSRDPFPPTSPDARKMMTSPLTPPLPSMSPGRVSDWLVCFYAESWDYPTPRGCHRVVHTYIHTPFSRIYCRVRSLKTTCVISFHGVGATAPRGWFCLVCGCTAVHSCVLSGLCVSGINHTGVFFGGWSLLCDARNWCCSYPSCCRSLATSLHPHGHALVLAHAHTA